MTSRVCSLPACLFLRRYKFKRKPSLNGGGDCLEGQLSASEPSWF